MGGNKHKGQAQRTKNNAKPSNSGRIAELVDKGHQFPSFSGCSEARSTLNQSVSNINVDVFSPNVDPNFTVVLKKMSKKDATTRFKALQELKELCKESSPEVIVEVLPVWCKVYTLLAIDVEHRVREAVQDVHRLVVSRVGRNLAPHLKVITPLWFLSQYDSYAPAACIASAAFQEAFPPHKITEVIAFCQGEILEYIQGNLLNLTPQALSKGDLTKDEMDLKYERIIICSLNGLALYLSKVPAEQVNKYENVLKEILSSPKFWKFSKYKSPGFSLTKDEMDLKYERIIICSLNGLALYLSKVPAEQVNKYENVLKEILSSPKFWKFSKYKSPGVRSAWFSLLSSLCQHSAPLLEHEKKHVANSVISGIDDYDSSVLSVVWEAALRSFTAIEDFWQHVNIDKFFLPKFTNILRVGGQGNASCIYPNILLLLNSIPSSVIKDGQNFYQKIFTNFLDGMKQPLVYQSPSESEAVISSYIECSKYIIMKNLDDDNFSSFVLQQLCQVISTSMTQLNFRNIIKPLYRHLYQMLLFWQKNESSDKYVILQRTLWERMSNISTTNLTEALIDKDQLLLCLNSQYLMLSMLNSPTATKQKLKVSFADSLTEESTIDQTENIQVKSSEKNAAERKTEENILNLSEILLQTYYRLALDLNYKHFKITFITQIQKVADLFGERVLGRVELLEPSWANSLLVWIQSEDIPVKCIISMLFDTVSFFEPSKQEEIINHLTQVRCNESLEEGLQLATQKDSTVLKEWLNSDRIKNIICNEYDRIYSNESSSYGVLRSCLLLNKNGDFVIGDATILALIRKIEDQLISEDETKIKVAAGAIDILVENISEVKASKHEDLIFQLLKPLFDNIVRGKGFLVYETWQKAVIVLSKNPSGHKFLKTHLENLSSELGISITSMGTIFDVKLIHQAVILLLSVLVCNDEKEMESFGMPCIRLLLTSVFTKAVEESKQRLEDVCMVAEVINGNLPFDLNSERMYNIIVEIIDKWSPLSSVNTLGFVNSLVFSLKIIASALGIDLDSDNICEDEDDEICENVTLPKLPMETTPEFCEYLVELTYGLVLLKKMQSYYYSTKEYFTVACLVEPFERDVKELVQRCQSTEQEKLLIIISNKSNRNGCLWTQVKGHMLDFLDGTYQENSALVTRDNESIIPTEILSVPHIHKLKNIIKNKGLSKVILNEALTIVHSRYTAQYPVFDQKLNDVEREYLILSAEIARLFEVAVATSPLLLTQTSWDFARISVVGWLHRIALTVHLQENYIEFVTLTNAVCSLLTTLSKTFMDESLSDSLSSYCEEWKEVFAADAFYFLCKSWEIVIEERCTSVNDVGFLHIETVGKTVCELCRLEPLSVWKSRIGTRDWVKLAITGILIPFVPVQITSYRLLVLFLPAMMELDEGLDESSLDKVSCNMLEEKLSATQVVLMAMLQDYSTGISCSVSPFTDSYVYTLGYLLLWSTLIQFCYQCQSQQRYLYPLWIKEKNIVSPFMEAVVKLMPECVHYYQESNNKKAQEFFTSPPSIFFDGWTSDKLSHLCCWLMTELMGHLPAVVRQWASEAEPKQLSFVDRIATAFVTPYLSSREMEAIKGQHKSFDNMKVFTYPTVGEVIAVYTVEESSTELSIQLSNNYPLSPPKVDISKAMVSSIQTRQWLKQLTIFLTHQNGSIWDGLVMWKNNLDKKFEGIEECYICFSILHTTTHQLPRLSCHTCKKKFHSFCLYKWFSTSNKSTCPICRAIF